MHIGHIIDSLGWGGAQKMQVAFAAAAQQRDVTLTVISLGQDSNTPFPEELRSFGARVVTFPSNHLLNPKRLWQLSRFLRHQRFDVLHTHLTYANIVGTLAGQLAGLPVVASLRSEVPSSRFFIRQLETWVLRSQAQSVMAVGHTVAQAHQERLPGKSITVIPNAVFPPPPLAPTERIALRAQLLGDASRPLIISVGRLESPKGYPDLIDAFALIHRTAPAAALVIAGSGSLHAALAARIAAHNLTDHAVLLGARTDVPRLLAASDIYVSSSHWEGLPVSVLEAMAAGLPIVATQVGDLPQIVVANTGILVPPREPTRLASALSVLLEEPTQRLAFGTAAQAHVTRQHSPDTWFEQLLSLYAEIRLTRQPTPSPLLEVR